MTRVRKTLRARRPAQAGTAASALSPADRRLLTRLRQANQANLHDVGVGFAASTQGTTMGIPALNLIVQGDLQGNRAGCNISMTRIRGYFALKTLAVASPVIRMALLYDHQTNGVAPTAVMIQETPSGGNEAYALMPNFNYRKRIEVLHDWILPLSTLDDTCKIIHFDINLNGRPTEYVAGAGAGTVADIVTGGLFLYILADTAASATIAFQAQLFYTD